MGTKLTSFDIKGERCSGTNYLTKLIETNLKIKYKPNTGWKHGWFKPDGNALLQKDAATIVIFRNFSDWSRSLYLQPHSIATWALPKPPTFSEFIRMEVRNTPHVGNSGVKEILDLHPFTLCPPKNILETRKWKGEHFLSLGKVVPNVHFVKYEDLLANPEKIVKEINDKWFDVDYEFQNWTNYKSFDTPYVKKIYADISEDDKNFIFENIDWDLEARMGYLSIFN